MVNHGGLTDFHIIGVGRKPLTSRSLINSSKKYITKPSLRMMSRLRKNTSYVQMDFKEPDFDPLKSE